MVEEKVHYALPRTTDPQLRSERQRSLVFFARSPLHIAIPRAPAGLAKLFLFESRLPEALTELSCAEGRARELHPQRGQHRQDEHHR